LRGVEKEKVICVKMQIKLKDERASVLVIFAVLLPIFLLMIGFVVDIGGAIVLKEQLYKACLISSEEATKSIDISKAQNEGLNVLNCEFDDVIEEFFNKNTKFASNIHLNYLDYEVVESISNPKYIKVSAEAIYETFFLKVIGINEIKVHSKAEGRLKRIMDF